MDFTFSVIEVVQTSLRMATRYAHAPLLPHGRSSTSCTAKQMQCSSSFPTPNKFSSHRCTCLTR